MIVVDVVEHLGRRQDVDQRLCLWHERPQQRVSHVELGDRASDELRQQRGVDASQQLVGVKRQHQRSEHMQAVDLPQRVHRTGQTSADATQVAGSQLRAAQSQRLDEQDPVVHRCAHEQMLLVGEQVGVPVGEAHTHDVASAQRHARQLRRAMGTELAI